MLTKSHVNNDRKKARIDFSGLTSWRYNTCERSVPVVA